jgi:hypothetical protein
MKKAFIITSANEVDNNYPLTYSKTRTHFDSTDRFRHTVFTVASLDGLRDPDVTIFVVDASDTWQNYAGVLGYQKNLKFVSVKEEFPEIYQAVRTHKNKSHCESLMLSKFVEKYKEELKQYDYILKLSGRYFIDSNFTLAHFTEENKDKFFFKQPLKFDWNEHWNYKMVDRRSIQGDNKLWQYSSVLYGWGSDNLDKMIDIYRVIAVFTDPPNGPIYDIESLLYFFTREFENRVIETNWIVYGWDGTSGNFLRY